MLRQVLAQYENPPFTQQLYSIVRWRICPFARLAEFVPPHGKLLDIGCGYGLWLNYLALCYPELDLTGIDIDPRKLRGARRSRNPLLVFEERGWDALPAQKYDCITFVDVLYLMDAKTKQLAITNAFRALKPGGLLLLKEMDTRPRWKFAWNVFEETLAVKMFGLTRGEQIEFVSASQQAQMLSEMGMTHIEIMPMDQGYLHPHVLIRAKKFE